MSAQEFATEHAETQIPARRVVEAEIKIPRLEELTLPKVDLEPVRAVAEQVLLISIGVGVLLVRSLVRVVKTANEAGIEAARNPGPVTRALLSLVRTGAATSSSVGSPAATEVRVKVPILPVDHYDALSSVEIVERLPGLPIEQVRLVREYELDHQGRAAVLEAIDHRLAAG